MTGQRSARVCHAEQRPDSVTQVAGGRLDSSSLDLQRTPSGAHRPGGCVGADPRERCQPHLEQSMSRWLCDGRRAHGMTSLTAFLDPHTCVCVTHTHLDAQVKVHVVSNIHTPNVGPAPCEARAGVLFVGSFEHPPNREAVQHLISDILPEALARLPAALAPRFKVGVEGGGQAELARGVPLPLLRCFPLPSLWCFPLPSLRCVPLPLLCCSPLPLLR